MRVNLQLWIDSDWTGKYLKTSSPGENNTSARVRACVRAW